MACAPDPGHGEDVTAKQFSWVETTNGPIVLGAQRLGADAHAALRREEHDRLIAWTRAPERTEDQRANGLRRLRVHRYHRDLLPTTAPDLV